MNDAATPTVEMLDICKQYPGGTIANDHVSFLARQSEIHAVIGENGAGKTTLMSILYGRIIPDHGTIRIRGKEVRLATPADALALGIGLVSQHTTVIPALSLLENAMLGFEPTRGGWLRPSSALRQLQNLAGTLDADIDWTARAEGLSVATLQKAEILKALYRGANILILDEPTATLAPHEADALFHILHGLTSRGTTVLLVTHKIREVMEHSDAVTVLRRGHTIGERRTINTNSADLTALVLGHSTIDQTTQPVSVPMQGTQTPSARSSVSSSVAPLMELRGVTVLNDRQAPAVRNVSLSMYHGEILGIAGVDGSGQRELAEAMVGLRRPASGSINLQGHDVSAQGVRARAELGVRFVPEDRQTEGLVEPMSIAENLALSRCRSRSYRAGVLLSPHRMCEQAEASIDRFHIQTSSANEPVSDLSGGNQQKVVLARALSGTPALVVAIQPTRGLDIGATQEVYDALEEVRRAGAAAVVFSLDIDELLTVSDRIAVMYNGAVAGILPRAEATSDEIGRMMLGGAAQGNAQ